LNQSLVSAESECIHLTGNTFSTSYMMSMFNEGQVWSYHKVPYLHYILKNKIIHLMSNNLDQF